MASVFGKKKEKEIDYERTRIILSFAMANHGSAFGHWLRNQLMLHYGLFGVKSVYLDSVVCRSVDGPKSVMREGDDSRNETESGMRPIGCRRDDWNEMYLAAMMQADVALIVFTNEYEASPNCMKELGQFGANNEIRIAKNLKPLRGVVLDITDTPVPAPVVQFSVTRLRLKKTFGQTAGGAWDVGDYTLDPSDFRLLTQAIGVLS